MKYTITVQSEGWEAKVGFYPTPANIVNQFSKFTYNFAKNYINRSKIVRILDLFAGDGRLGFEIANILKTKKYSIEQTFIEIQHEEAKKIRKGNKYSKVITRNAFEWHPYKKFDLIVSNPPYLIINSPMAAKLGFEWEYARKNGRNLYTLGIIKGLELCRDGGILAVISPFSWLRGEFSASFREEINEKCSRVFIKANDHRTVFKDVNQDIGIQIFIKRSKTDTYSTDWKFGYNGDEPKTILFENFKKDYKSNLSEYRITVGPVVWNRKKEFLTKIAKNNVRVIYGGNIGHDSKLHFNVPRYKDKQFIEKAALIETDVFFSPLILIRRIMRGIPGNWEIDSCLIEKPFICTAENHVIVIEVPLRRLKSFKILHKKLMGKLKEYYYFSGTPSISVKVVKKILSELDSSIQITEKNKKHQVNQNDLNENMFSKLTF